MEKIRESSFRKKGENNMRIIIRIQGCNISRDYESACNKTRTKRTRKMLIAQYLATILNQGCNEIIDSWPRFLQYLKKIDWLVPYIL